MDSTLVGFLFSATGPYGAIGRTMLNGALLAAHEVNETAARDGRIAPLQPVLADPAGELSRYPLLCQRLIDGGARHVVGCYTSSSRKELIPLVEKRDALLWYPSHYEGFESAANVVYTGAAPNQHIVPLVEHVLRQSGQRYFCIGSNYIWAWENNRILREAILGRGGSIVSERYLAIGEQDVSQAVAAILEAMPDYVFCTLIGTSCWRFFTELRAACRARGLDQPRDLPVLSCSLSEPELAEIPADARDGHLSSSVYFSSVDTPASRRFVAAYDRQHPDGPAASADAESAYIAVHLLALALAAAGSSAIEPVRAAATRHAFAAPQGEVRLDPQTMHAWLTPRIGRSRTDGRFDIMYEAAAPVAPDPYLVRSGPRLSRAAPSLRIVS